MKRSILPILLFCLLTFCLPLVSLLPQAAGQAASSVSLAAGSAGEQKHLRLPCAGKRCHIPGGPVRPACRNTRACPGGDPGAEHLHRRGAGGAGAGVHDRRGGQRDAHHLAGQGAEGSGHRRPQLRLVSAGSRQHRSAGRRLVFGGPGPPPGLHDHRGAAKLLGRRIRSQLPAAENAAGTAGAHGAFI